MMQPFVTVIMPIRNEAAFIERSLGAVLAQDYPSDRLEVLVVDGMSNDQTRTLVQRFIDQQATSGHTSRPRITLLDNPGQIVPCAFNIGLRYAEGAIIVRVDGHCEIAPDYVSCCVATLATTGADNVGGLIRSVSHGVIGHAIAMATSSPFGVGNARFHYATQAGWADTVYLGAYRREVFERIGGFDEELGRNQGDEFNFRLTQHGGRIWLNPTIRSTYYSRTSLRKLWRQYFQYGFYKVRVIQKRNAVASWCHLIPATFVLSLVVSILLALISLLALSAAGSYALANTGASVWVSRRDPLHIPLIALVFLVLHVAYGLGFLRGFWHWSRRPIVPTQVLDIPKECVA